MEKNKVSFDFHLHLNWILLSDDVNAYVIVCHSDVAPVHPDCHAFVMLQRREVFDDLHNALRVMNIIGEQTPIPNVLYAMWLLENKQLRLGVNINVSIWHTFNRSP